MSRFAQAAPRSKTPATPDTVNLAGGTAYKQEAKLELASILATSFLTDQFYRGADATIDRVVELLSKVDPYFAAQAAVYMRNTDGMRSITHVVAAELARRVKGEEWMKRFLFAVVRRPDDATEILAYYLAKYGKPVPNSLKKGLGLALGKFDAYQLAKYRGEGKAISLVDVVNLTHPRPTSRNGDALSKLVNGTLRNERTWEAQLSAAGNSAEAKADAWAAQLGDGSIGQLALLRNLRNIEGQVPHLVPRAVELLTDGARVEKSLIFPFQYLQAYKVVSAPALKSAVSRALDLSIGIVPDLGETLVAIDGSGSMSSPVAGGDIRCVEVGALFGAVYFKKNHSKVGLFESGWTEVTGLNPDDSTLTLVNQIMRFRAGYATNFDAIFTSGAGRKKYDSVVIFSDMQANIGSGHGGLKSYRSRVKGANPNVFAFDLAGYGSSQFDPRGKVFQLAGFSDKSFGLLGKLSEDPNALVTAIEKVTF